MAKSDDASHGPSSFSDRVALVSVAALVVLSLLGSIMTIGDRLSSLGPVPGALFYALVAVLVVTGVVCPLVRIATHPVFSLYLLRRDGGQPDARRCRRLLNEVARNVDLNDEELERLESVRVSGEDIDDQTIAFYMDVLVPRMKAEVTNSAKAAFFATAISRSSLVDTVTMAALSLKLVRSIVECCGFRPCLPSLMKLYAKLTVTALVAGGIEELDLDDLIASLMGGAAGAKVSGALFSGVAQGTVNAFLIYRIGSMTIGYLCSQDGPARLSELKRSSYKDAMRMMETSGLLNDIADFIKEGMKTVAQSAATAARQTAKTVGKSAMDTVTTGATKFGEAIKGAATKVSRSGARLDSAQQVGEIAGEN